MVDFHVEIEHLVEVEGVESGNGHAERVANEVANVMVLEECGILGKDLTFIGLFDVGLEGHEPVFAGFIEEVVHHFQGVDVGLLSEF